MKKFAKISVVTLLLVALLAITLVSFTACDDCGAGYLPENNIRLPLSKKTVLGNLPVGLLVSNEHSYIELTTEGYCNLSIMLHVSELVPMLNSLVNLEEVLSGIDKPFINSAFVDGYVRVMFPDFSLSDVKGSLSLVKESLGVDIVGYDANFQKLDLYTQNQQFMDLVATIEDETTDAMFPDGFDLANLPEWVGIEIHAPYNMLDITGEDGTQYHAVLVGSHAPKSLPLITMTYDETSQSIVWVNEMLGLKVVAKDDKAET